MAALASPRFPVHASPRKPHTLLRRRLGTHIPSSHTPLHPYSLVTYPMCADTGKPRGTYCCVCRAARLAVAILRAVQRTRRASGLGPGAVEDETGRIVCGN